MHLRVFSNISKGNIDVRNQIKHNVEFSINNTVT